MFCGNCGKENNNINFCIYCGCKSQKLSHGTESELTSSALKKEFNIMPVLDSPISVWKKNKFTIRSNAIPEELEWVLKEVDLIITPQGTLVIAAKPITKTFKTTEKIALGAVALGSIAGLAVAIPAALIGETYEKIYGSSNLLNRESLEIFFKSNNLLWIPHSSDSYRCFNVNGGLFGDLATVGVVSGNFHYNNGIFSMSISERDHGWGKLSQIKKAFSNSIISSKQYDVKKDDYINNILDEEYSLIDGFEVKAMRKAISGK